KEPSPGGLRRFSVLASLLLGHSPTSGDAPSSRLARTENRRNKRGRIYETGYLGFHSFDWSKWTSGTPEQKLGLLPAGQNISTTLPPTDKNRTVACATPRTRRDRRQQRHRGHRGVCRKHACQSVWNASIVFAVELLKFEPE